MNSVRIFRPVLQIVVYDEAVNYDNWRQVFTATKFKPESNVITDGYHRKNQTFIILVLRRKFYQGSQQNTKERFHYLQHSYFRNENIIGGQSILIIAEKSK